MTTNDVARRTVSLELTGEIVAPIKIDPPSAFFGTLQDDVVQQRVLSIINNMDAPLEIKRIKNASAKIEAELNTLTPGKEFQLTVRALPPFQSGYLRCAIVLETNLPEMPLVTIHVNGYRPSAVEVKPRLVSLPTVIAGDFRRQIFVRHTKRHPLRLTELQVSSEKLQVSLGEAQPVGESYWIVVTAPPGYQLPKTGERITFRTDDPSTPRVSVPVVQRRRTVLEKGD